MKNLWKEIWSAFLFLNLMVLILVLGGCRFTAVDQHIQATGTIEMTETTISSKTSARVINIKVEEGQKVKQGDLLAELDHEELDAQIAAARSNLDVAVANYDAAKTDFHRNKQLYQSQQISESVYDQAATKADVTQAQVRQAKANIDLLVAQLKNVKIMAPSSGVISEKMIENGEIISSGTAVFTLLDYDKPWVKVYLPLQEVSRVTLNEKAYVKLDAFPKKRFYGRISFISKEAEFTPKDFLSKEERIKQVFSVKVQLKNKEELLKAGLPVDVWVVER
jgi:HlyD family secretion protein